LGRGRVNYDIPLVGIARMVVAPPAQWSSDRSVLLRPRKMSFKEHLLGPKRAPVDLSGELREEIVG